MEIKVLAKPSSPFQKIEKVSENEFIVFLKSPPSKNKANLELIKILRKYFNDDVFLVRGKNSKRKVLRIGNGN
ncbi:DUF167 domain-containing protein [Candidatus Pacearchaeota archaeon]|nr:MAG: DUF167 domain-containing protein [Candidatus Pacearchaeota archaeon]